jgi:hypothetical protein
VVKTGTLHFRFPQAPGEVWLADVRLHPVDEAMARRTIRFTPDTAAVLDEDSMCHLPGGSAAFVRPLVYDARASPGRLDAPYGQYLPDDALAGEVPGKLPFHLAAWALTPAERVQFKASRAPNTTRVWCYAPGYVCPDRLDVAGVKDVTGFEAHPVSLATAAVTSTPVGTAVGLTGGGEAADPWGPKEPIQPRLAATAMPQQTWATCSDGSPAVVMRETQSGTDVFLGVPALTPELVRPLGSEPPRNGEGADGAEGSAHRTRRDGARLRGGAGRPLTPLYRRRRRLRRTATTGPTGTRASSRARQKAHRADSVKVPRSRTSAQRRCQPCAIVFSCVVP